VRRRLLLSYLTITVLVLVGLEVPLGFSFARSERRHLQQSVREDAVTLSVRAEEDLESGPDAAGLAELQALVARYQHDNGDHVIVADRAGRPLASSEPGGRDLTEGREVLEPPEIRQALAGRTTSGTHHSEAAGGDVRFEALPVTSGGTVIGVVRVTRPLASVNERVRNNWLLLATVGGAVLAVVFGVSLLVARSVTRPLADLSRAASRLGAGELDARTRVPAGPAEVRTLAEEFNRTGGQLESLVHSQQQFVADASHQLRTPLAALRLRLENLESEVGPAAGDDVEGARAEVERLSRLVDGLLLLARAERVPATPVNVDLGQVVSGRRDAWLALAGERDVALRADVPGGLWARATPERLEQVLDNLLNNALEQTPSGGAVTLRAEQARDRVQIRVRDDGPGMTDEEQARAFDRFWRGATASSDNGGFGLGLAIVAQLVRADGGTVELRSPPSGGLEVVIGLRAGSRAVPDHHAAAGPEAPVPPPSQ
jgi:signal transduction histidine kinase